MLLVGNKFEMTLKVVPHLCILACISVSLGYSFKPKSVTINLNSNWKDTPLYLEASEFLAEENNEYFWRYISDISSLESEAFYSRSPKEQYELILNITSRILSPAKFSLLKFSLALRAHSPTVEMFHQIAEHKHLPENCDAVIEVSGEFACDILEIERLLETALERPLSDIYIVDHHYPGTSSLPTTAILYGEIGTEAFKKMHRVLQEKAEKREIGYVLRHYIQNRSEQKVRLSGYGVELAIKSTEYKAQDDTKVKGEDIQGDPIVETQEEVQGFVFKKLKEMYPDKSQNLDEFKAYLLDSMKEIPTLKVWELQELSLQAAQRIMKSPVEEALRVMRDIAQNFPTQAKSLVHTAVPSEMKSEIERNQQMFLQHLNLGPSDAALFINGMYFDMEVADIFTLLQSLKQETRLLEGLNAIGVPESQIGSILKLDLSDDKQEFAVDIRDSAIQYVNDLEHDSQYRGWPGSIQDMLRPTYPGMLRHVRKNIYHLVLIVDPSKNADRDIVRLAESFYVHKAPVRIGLIFAVNANTSVSGLQDAGVAMLNAYNFIAQDKKPYDGLSFITDIYAMAEDREITAEDVVSLFKSRFPGEDLDMVFGADSDYDTGRRLAWDFINRTGLGSPPQALLNGVVLKQTHLNADMFEEVVLTEIMKQTPLVQKSVYKGELSDSDSVIDFLMSQKNVMPRLNQRILAPGGQYVDMTGHVVSDLSREDYAHLSNVDFTSTLASQLKYVSEQDDVCVPVSIWVVADLETPEGRSIVLDAILHAMASSDAQAAVIHNPGKLSLEENVIGKIVHVALNTLDPAALKQVLLKVLKEKNAVALQQGTKTIADVLEGNHEELLENLKKETGDFLHIHSTYAKKVLNFAASVRAVIANGRVIGPLNREEVFGEDDFNLLERYSMTVYGEKLHTELLKETSISNSPLCSNLIMKATSVLLANPQSRTRHEIKFYDDKHSALKFPVPNPKEPAHDLLAIVDPVSRGAQKLVPILMTLRQVVNANLKIFFNCIDKHSSMPLKSFYRFVLEGEPHFEADGSPLGPMAQFVGMPMAPLFTLAMATPENWLVEAVVSPYDLDNIHLQEVSNAVHAEFELEHLLLEGHCFEQSTGNPPRGLQFTLGTNNAPVKVDTIVMANLGYFQLKANPGAWLLRLRQGRSADLYDIVSHDGTGTPPGSSEVVALLGNFRSQVIKIKVNKKPGKQHEELLYDPDDDDSSIWGSITSKFTGDKKPSDDEADDKINIFSLASGHLYERLLRIMMLSVIKNTNTPVKFWFLKNYLSPTFKDFLPYMAKEYGFEYELVQYKWPRWLNQQTEKQRVIWGYKILFLDVLFPLDVKKIIFVDADQVVRADLKELRDLDLEGAPYGYTPFCESRKEMDGYRFWKSGYWASHLHGRSYHISALYVVDLKKFRRIAAGDRLRGQYQGLSQDPNSLSNLDQDLPNNMIHQVSIKSLPQEWLWCETWCSDESKKQAKTIDLCNNPMTKEPKLTSARRIIPEWSDYDSEIKSLLDRYEQSKSNSVYIDTRSSESSKTFPESQQATSFESAGGEDEDIHEEL